MDGLPPDKVAIRHIVHFARKSETTHWRIGSHQHEEICRLITKPYLGRRDADELALDGTAADSHLQLQIRIYPAVLGRVDDSGALL